MSQFNQTTKITLTANEEKIFQLLRDTVAYKNRTTVLRIAGGWVRDKMLGVESDDIDVAIDDGMGEEFALAIQEYLSTLEGSHGQAHQEDVKAGKIGVISANPEQSKHLETATMKIYGQEIDFVNLRSEEYSDTSSRIPTMKLGTPSEDAYRRDFTINSLFYNLMTNSIEDLTLQGIPDMQAGLVRTPLPAITTFTDDPLRLLRAVRFASRYDFTLDEEILAAGQMPEIHDALRHKISKERIYKELNGCFSGKLARPVAAIAFLQNMNLFGVLFGPPSLSHLQSLRASVDASTSQVLACQQKSARVYGVEVKNMHTAELSLDSVLNKWQDTSLGTLKAVNLLLQMELLGHQFSLFTPKPLPDSDVSLALSAGSTLDMTTLMEAIQLVKERNASSDEEKGEMNSDACVVSTDALMQSLGKGGNDNDRNSAIDSLENQCSIAALLWSSCVAGLRDIRILTEKNKATSLYLVLLFNGFKLSTSLLKQVESILAHARDFQALATAQARFICQHSRMLSDNCTSNLTANDAYSSKGGCIDDEASLVMADLREDIGVVLRVCKHSWRSSLLMACALELSSDSDLITKEASVKKEEDLSPAASLVTLIAPVVLRSAEDNGTEFTQSTQTAAIIAKYQRLLRTIELLGLSSVWSDITPFFHGKALLSQLGIRPGPVMGRLMDFQFRWQVRNPLGTKDSCLEALRGELERVTTEMERK